MSRTERSQRDAQLILRGFDLSRIVQDRLNQRAAFLFDSFVVRADQLQQITLDLLGDHFQDIGEVLAFGG